MVTVRTWPRIQPPFSRSLHRLRRALATPTPAGTRPQLGARWSRAIAGLSLVANPLSWRPSPPALPSGFAPTEVAPDPLDARSNARAGGYGAGMPSKPPDEGYWLERAREARLQADQLTTPDAMAKALCDAKA